MKFRDSGLPTDKIVEDAFNYSYESVMSQRDAMVAYHHQQIDMMQMQALQALNLYRDSNAMPDSDYQREKANLEKMYTDELKAMPRGVDEALKMTFNLHHLNLALEIYRHSDKPSPELVAAALLSSSVRSAIDYERVIESFGRGISGVIAEYGHINAYPGQAQELLKAAGPDVKRVCLAMLCADLTHVYNIAKGNPGQRISFPPGQEKTLFDNAIQLWNNDKKLDQRFVEVFNRTAEAVASDARMNIADGGGALQMVQGNMLPPNNSGPRPSGPGPSGGDNVF